MGNVAKGKKTKDWYLKDGFVVDGSDDEDISVSEEEDFVSSTEEAGDDDDEDDPLNHGDELTEESYDYDSETDKRR